MQLQLVGKAIRAAPISNDRDTVRRDICTPEECDEQVEVIVRNGFEQWRAFGLHLYPKPRECFCIPGENGSLQGSNARAGEKIYGTNYVPKTKRNTEQGSNPG